MIAKPILRWLRRGKTIALIGIGESKTTQFAQESMNTFMFNHVISPMIDGRFTPYANHNMIQYAETFTSDLPFEVHGQYQERCSKQWFHTAKLGFEPRMLMEIDSKDSVEEFKRELMLSGDWSYTVIRTPDGSPEKYEWFMLDEHVFTGSTKVVNMLT